MPLRQVLLEEGIEDLKLAVCEDTLMPVPDEYAYIHHNSMELGFIKYIEKAP